MKKLQLVYPFFISIVILSVMLSCDKRDNIHDSDKADYALWFDGEDDYVEIPDDLSLQVADEITLEAWIKFEEGGTMQPRILSKGNDGYGFEVVLDNSGSIRKIELRIGPGYLISTSDLLANQWYHIAFIYDMTNITLLIDGKIDNKTTANGSLNINNSSLYFGQKSTGAWDKYKGYIDEIRIWSVARTQKEIQDNMYLGITDESDGLAGYWSFNVGAGQVAMDSSKNKNHGTLIGGVQWVEKKLNR